MTMWACYVKKSFFNIISIIMYITLWFILYPSNFYSLKDSLVAY